MQGNDYEQAKTMISRSLHLLLLLSRYKNGEIFLRTSDYKRIGNDEAPSVFLDAVNDAMAENPLYFEYEILMEYHVEPGLDVVLEKSNTFHNVEIIHMADGSSVIRAVVTPSNEECGKYRLDMVHGKNYAHALLNSQHRNTRNAMRTFCSKCRSAVGRALKQKQAASESRRADTH